MAQRVSRRCALCSLTRRLTHASPFVAFNKLPRLPGNENIPPPADMVEATRTGLYRAKCDPQILDIIARARRMRKNHPLLKSVYILTDADRAWAEEVRMWLLSEGWDKVWVGREDLYPAWQDREVGVAVDMEVARRAGVFVGNGVSWLCAGVRVQRAMRNESRTRPGADGSSQRRARTSCCCGRGTRCTLI